MMDTYKIGRFIAACRKEKGMTQAQLAEKLGVTAKTISRWENGNYMPDLSLLIPISEILEISLNELLNGERIAQEDIVQEEILEKTESSISGALQYSAEQIKKGKKKTIVTVLLIVVLFVVILALAFAGLNRAYFSEISSHAGDVSQWEGLFPNHSAYELAISEANEPVFVDTNAALKKVKNDCSDAIREIKDAYDLLPLTKYTYKSYKLYAGRANLLFKTDERVMEQRQLLLNFLDIYENSYDWEIILEEEMATESQAEQDTEVAETTRKVVDTTNANIEVVAYEKEVELTGDDVVDLLRFSIYVTEEYKDITDTYELLSAPFVGRVRVFDGASGEEIWKSEQVSGDRLGNQQISLVTKEGENYLLVSQIHEQMGDGCYFYRVYSLEDKGQPMEGQPIENEQLNEETRLVDYYTVYFVLEDGGYRMRGNDKVRCEAVPDFKEHIENWLTDAELIIATDVMMERPDNILFSTTEKKISPKVYYDKVWARVKDQTATFELVCPEVSFPTEESWIQNLVCWAVDEQIAVAKYYDAKAGGSCAFHAGSYTEKEMQEEVEYAHYLYPDNVEEHHYQAETINDEIIDIYGYEIPYENGEYKKTMMTFWTYHDKTYTIFGELAADADVTSIIDTAVYIAERMN